MWLLSENDDGLRRAKTSGDRPRDACAGAIFLGEGAGGDCAVFRGSDRKAKFFWFFRRPYECACDGIEWVGRRSVNPFFNGEGHAVKRLVRQGNGRRDGAIDPPEQGPDPVSLEGIDAVVHLAAKASRAGGRKEKSGRFGTAASQGNRILVASLLKIKTPPKTLVCASAIGYYRNREEELLTGASPAGSDFLADVCRDWEAACEPAREKGIAWISSFRHNLRRGRGRARQDADAI